eukprot:1915052-Pyramimonas_sp.AAC.2
MTPESGPPVTRREVYAHSSRLARRGLLFADAASVNTHCPRCDSHDHTTSSAYIYASRLHLGKTPKTHTQPTPPKLHPHSDLLLTGSPDTAAAAAAAAVAQAPLQSPISPPRGVLPNTGRPP